MEERKVDVAIIGSGSAGLYALSQVKPSGKSFVLINGGEPGTTCARVGCMPSKAMIQVAEDYHRRTVLGRYGINGHDELVLDQGEAMEHVRDMRDNFVDRVRSNSTDNMSDQVFIEGYAKFIDPNTLEVEGQRFVTENIIIASGSRPIVPAAWQDFGNKILTTDDVFELEELPASMAVIGLGVIGLEIGQSLSRLDIDITGFDILETIGSLQDPEASKVAKETFARDFPIHLGAPAEISEEGDQLRVTAGNHSIVVDKVLVCMGRTPNIDNLDIEKAGIELDQRRIPVYDRSTMQISDSHIFIAGDVNGERQILHEAGDEGRIAGHNATSDSIKRFRRKTPLAIIFSDPNIAIIGKRWNELDQEQTAIGEVRMAPVGRAMIMGKNRGIIRVYADKKSGVILGSEMISPKGENLGHLLCWAIEQKLTVGDLLRLPFYHPVIEEALQAALNDLYSKVETKNEGPITELEVLQ
ncbi:MAG: dihydrolipoyl dehydrogenase [Gammaproteobacteria bacterium]|nr:dihydrolipoyl dehydrogenase [Gammaproteobacteria bacterium]